MMICDPCKAGDHRNCQQGECQCQDRLNEKINQELAKYVNASGDETLAEMIFSNLLYGGSEIARMLTEGAGKPAVKGFIQQVLRAAKAARC
jgi:hypothetical protein